MARHQERVFQVFLLLIALPSINAAGVRNGNRYLTDRRDLNRAFPGRARWQSAARGRESWNSVNHLRSWRAVSFPGARDCRRSQGSGKRIGVPGHDRPRRAGDS